MNDKLSAFFYGAATELKRHGLGAIEFAPEDEAHVLRVKTKKDKVCGSITVVESRLPDSEDDIVEFARAKVKEILGGIARDPAFKESQQA